MEDAELELALLERFLDQHRIAEREDPQRGRKCDRELDLRELLRDLSGKDGPDLDYEAQVWLKRLTSARSGRAPAALKQCSDGSKNGSEHRFHLRAYFDDTGVPAAERASELRETTGRRARHLRTGRDVRVDFSGPQLVLWELLHPDITAVARDRFEAGHFADAVEAALKEVNHRVKVLVREKTGQEYDGADLMNRAFSLNNPVLTLADLTTQSGKDEQKGYLQLFAGAMTGIRNPKAHANIEIDGVRAIHHLFVASLLSSKLDEAEAG